MVKLSHDQRVEQLTRFFIIISSFLFACIAIARAHYIVFRDADLETAKHNQLQVHEFARILLNLTEDEQTETELLMHLQAEHVENGYIMLISKDGDWVETKDPVFRHLTSVGDDSSFSSLFPDAWTMIFANQNGQHLETRGLFTYAQIDTLQADPEGYVVSFVPRKELFRRSNHFLLMMIGFSLALLLLLGFIIWIYTKGRTQRFEAEKHIENLNGVLQIINKILRHDIKNKLVGIRLALETYHEDKNKDMLQTVEEITESGISLVTKMKKLETLIDKSEKTKKIDVRNCVKKIKKGYTVPIHVKGRVSVRANELFESVLDNLIGNAVKHAETDQIVVELSEDLDHAIIKVIDYGTGIPNNIRQYFHTCTTDKEVQLKGLGLYISKKSVENLGGTIHIEDSKPKGTTFVIKLPK